MSLRENPFENMKGKGENAGNQHFSPLQCFPAFQREVVCLPMFSI